MTDSDIDQIISDWLEELPLERVELADITPEEWASLRATLQNLIAKRERLTKIKRDNQHQRIYNWLLGAAGDFPVSEPGKRYNWRTQLRNRIKELKSSLGELE